jgi:hypothetical protein
VLVQAQDTTFDNETILHQYDKGAKRANYKGNILFWCNDGCDE